EAAHRFSHTNRKGGDGLEPLEAAIRNLRRRPSACLRQNQFDIPKNSGERIVEFVAQDFSERIPIGNVARAAVALPCPVSSVLPEPRSCGGGQSFNQKQKPI